MARRTKEEAEKTKTDIIFAGLELFSCKGYSKTTFDDIAKQIGVTKGALYWHFRNKPDLLFEIIRRMFSTKIEKISSNNIVNDLDSLRDFFVMEAKLVENDSQYRKFLFFILFQMEWSEMLISKASQVIDDIHNFPIDLIRQALTKSKKNGEISENVNIEETIYVVISLWKGLLTTELGQTKKVQKFSDMVYQAFNIFFKGLN